jgi:serine phosphatase RsbU (regulator of sigma subunit)
VGVAKAAKFGVPESGDTLEVVERRKGGLSVVMADGQGSGFPAKRISNLVVSRAISLISEGARDGAVARAVHDVLFALRDGKVSCELTILSADLRTRTVVISRNTSVPVWVASRGELTVCSDDCQPIGMREVVKPCISEFPLEEGLLVVTFTDGVLHSGRNFGLGSALEAAGAMVGKSGPERTDELPRELLDMAIKRDSGRPQDDMTVVAMGVVGFEGEHKIRHMSVCFPA